MADLTVNIPFTLRVSHSYERGGEGYVAHDLIHGIAYGSEGQIKNKLKPTIQEQVEIGLRAAEYGNRGRILTCADGTILIIRWSHDQWGYSIAGGDRQFAGWNTGRANAAFDDVVADATEHANQSYGGVVSVTSL